jgi:hypothetical protein
MIRIFTCLKEVVKLHIDNEINNPSGYMKLLGGWIGARKHNQFYDVYWYTNFPKKTYDLHYYLRRIK